MNTRASAPPQQGFALIEALIALLIFSMAVLGLVGLQASMARATASAKYRAEAAYLATDLVGRMWVDAINLAQYRDNCNTYVSCKQWKDKLSATLPSGTYSLTICTATTATCTEQQIGQVSLTISWTMPYEGSHSFSTTTSINPNT
jgi:type IV pilus assembly protein PilV